MSNQELPGERLKAERCRQQLDEREVANRLHLSVTYLRAIEADDYDSLPEATFVKGYMRNYARLLGLPGEELAQAFMALERHREPEITAPQLVDPVAGRGGRWILPIVAVLVVLAILGWWFSASNEAAAPGVVDQVQQATPSADAKSNNADANNADANNAKAGDAKADDNAAAMPADAASSDASAMAPQAAAAVSTGAATDDTAVGHVDGSAVDNIVGSGTANTVVSSAGDTPDPQSPVAASKVATAVTGPSKLQLSFSANCWTRVTDAAGKVLFAGGRQAGDSLNISGKPPFQLVLGNAAGVSGLSVDGQAVTLADTGRGEVVHMQVP